MNTDENPENPDIITSAPRAPEHPSFVKPAWGLTHAIPEGTTLAWGARAIYSWQQVTRPVLTGTGRHKISRGRKLTSMTYEPSIDLLWDRMGWSSGGDEDPTTRQAMAEWINTEGLPAIRAACRKASIQPRDDGPSARVEHTSGGYTIVACPNGSCGYLYIAAWKVVN